MIGRRLTDDSSANGAWRDVTALLHERGECEPHGVVEVEVEAAVSVPLGVGTESGHDEQRGADRKCGHRDTDPHLQHEQTSTFIRISSAGRAGFSKWGGC